MTRIVFILNRHLYLFVISYYSGMIYKYCTHQAFEENFYQL